MKRPEVTCTHCGGTGHVPLSGVYLGTLKLLRDWPLTNGYELAKISDCAGTTMTNRLKVLERMGLAESARYGRKNKRLWRATK